MDMSLPAISLVFAAALMGKHVICDGPLQSLSMVRAKGYYGRPLGLMHAAIHVAGTFIVCVGFGVGLKFAMMLAAMDGMIHYHVDYAKEKTIRLNAWSSTDGPYWWAMTTDQALHHLTYLLITYLAFTRP